MVVLGIWIDILILLLGRSLAYRILLSPAQTKSDVSAIAGLGQELASRGHDVYILAREGLSLPESVQSQMTVIRYGDPERKILGDAIKASTQSLFESRGNIWKFVLNIVSVLTEECEALLSQDNLFYYNLSQLNLDMAVVDVAGIYKCTVLLPHRLNIPYICHTHVIEPWIARLPWLPSLAPTPHTQLFYIPANLSQFIDRLLCSLCAAAASIAVPLMESCEPEILKKYLRYGNFHSLDELASRSLLWLQSNDPLLSWHYPTMPHVVDVGGLTIRTPQPLPTGLQTLISSSGEGTVLVAFGTMISAIPMEIVRQMFAAFQRLPRYTFLWSFPNRSDLSISEVPANVHLHAWLPQIDVLSHPGLQLFITSGGMNSMYEAIYHGVPILAMPIAGEQHQNAKIIEMKGFGHVIDIFSFTPGDLYDGINYVLTTASFRNKTQRASRIFQERSETPRQVAARWVEHVLKHGNEHLKSHAFDLSWWSFWLLDVMAVLVLIFLVNSYIGWLVCRSLFHSWSGQQGQKNKTE